MTRLCVQVKSLRVALALAALIGPLATPTASEAGRFFSAMVFRESAIRQVSISPSGEWVVAVVQEGDHYGVFAQRRGEGVKRLVHRSSQPILRDTWIGANSLALELDTEGLTFPTHVTVLRFRPGLEDDVADEVSITRRGEIVGVLRAEDEMVLWAYRADGESVVDRVSIDALASPEKYEDGSRDDIGRVAEIDERVLHWVADQAGNVVAYSAVEYERSGSVRFSVGYRVSPSAPWHTLWEGEERSEDRINPLGVTADGEHLVVAAYAGRDTLGIHEYDPRTRTVTRAISMRDDVDAVSTITDYSGTEIIAVGYRVGGRTQYDYLRGYAEEHLPEIAARVRDEGLRITSSSLDRQYFTLLSSGPREPGTHYYYARPSGTFRKLGQQIPDLTPEQLPSFHVIEATAEDGSRLEGFLTLPESRKPGRKPLLVLPHGGPFGPADGGRFDPLVQYMALSGIAVLQVNYRGSGGYGRKFEEAGAQQWGKGIEDDIDAVVQAAIDAGQVDPDRMCIAGGSYGGYSALISAIRRPERYRCVGTLNGVTDIPLHLQGSRSSNYRGFSTWSEAWIGDPETQMEDLVDVSPVYRVEDVTMPVWIAQGGRDERVDPEHAYRLRAMLEAHGKPYEWLFVEKGHHVPTSAEWVRYASSLRNFLMKHLGRTRPHYAKP